MQAARSPIAAVIDSPIPAIIEKFEGDILEEWLREQFAAATLRKDLMSEAEAREQSRAFLQALREAALDGPIGDIRGAEWAAVRRLLDELSASRTRQGFNASEVASFVFSLKQPLFTRLRKEVEVDEVADALWQVTTLLDKLGLYTTEVFQRTREEVIERQRDEMLELSTPVVTLWDGILALPIIGTLDSKRTQSVMEALLQRIVETGSEFAIIDITGVPVVDTLTAQHLVKTVTATRLLGAECIISGIRPQIAQAVVHLGVDLSGVLTKATLAGALKLAFERRGLTVSARSKADGREPARREA